MTAVSFGYNGLGDRLQQTMGGVTTRFALDLNNSLAQVLSDGSSTYLYGLGRVAQQNIVGWQYYQADALGSVRQLVNAAGTVIQARNYEPFGKQLSAAGNPLTKYGFTGEWTDPTGLIFLRARYYDPATGRFLSKDPVRGLITLPVTLNPYSYAVNNPLRYTDPSGKFPFLLFIAGGLIGGAIYGYGSQVINNLNKGMCLGDALFTNIDWLSFWFYTGIGGLLGVGMGGVAFGGWWGLVASGVTTPALQQGGQRILSIPASSIKFTQGNISPYTRAGIYLDDLAQEIENGFFRGYLRLVEYEDNLYSLDNRRLAAFKLLDKSVPAIIEDLSNPAIQAEFVRKFTTISEGQSIFVRGTDLIIK